MGCSIQKEDAVFVFQNPSQISSSVNCVHFVLFKCFNLFFCKLRSGLFPLKLLSLVCQLEKKVAVTGELKLQSDLPALDAVVSGHQITSDRTRSRPIH